MMPLNLSSNGFTQMGGPLVFTGPSQVKSTCGSFSRTLWELGFFHCPSRLLILPSDLSSFQPRVRRM